MTAGKHGFSGAHAPKRGNTRGTFSGQVNFSMGIFQWKSKRGGQLFKGRVKVRVFGRCAESEKVYAKAEEIARLLDLGTYSGPNQVTAD